MERKNVTFLTQSAMIAAIYVVLTVVFAPFSFGEVQVRVSEMLTILPIFTPAAIPGLFVGCLIGNILGGAVLPDIIFGSLATLIGAVCTWEHKRSEALDRSAATGSGEYLHRTVRTALCIRRNASDPAHDADRWNRRGNFL